MDHVNRLFDRKAIRELEDIAIDSHGIPGITLMRRAGLSAFDLILDRWPNIRSITVVCGTGNNAGDGYVVAGLAFNRGIEVQVIQVGDHTKLRDDGLKAYQWAKEQGIEHQSEVEIVGQVIVDALLGIGATGTVREDFVYAIDKINASPAPVVALDLPSGISADTGALMTNSPVVADITITFVGVILGFCTGDGVDYTGQIELCTLDLPPEVFEKVEGVPVISTGVLPKRRRSAYKNQLGHLLVIGGERGMGGAALLASEAALRAGVGLVSVVTRSAHVSGFIGRRPELMVQGVEEDDLSSLDDLLDRVDAIAIGPGLGRESWGYALLAKTLKARKPIVFDADALNLLAKENLTIPPESILTPHTGEAVRLLGDVPINVREERQRAVEKLADYYGSTIVLKGPGTLVADKNGLSGICILGNPGMATAGSGDVLTGVIGALRAQGLLSTEAAEKGVWLHAAAGDRAFDSLGGGAIIASDIVENLRVFHK